MKTSPSHSYHYGDQSESIDDSSKALTMDTDMQKSLDGMGKELQNDYDPECNTETETKSVSSVKSNGSNAELRYF